MTLQLPSFYFFIYECIVNQALPGLTLSHCSLSHSFFFFFLIVPSSPPFIPLHPSLPVPSEGACSGWPLSQNKHTTPDSISPGQHLRTNFLLMDLHPSPLPPIFHPCPHPSLLLLLLFCVSATFLFSYVIFLPNVLL